jgi:hypothetical protein
MRMADWLLFTVFLSALLTLTLTTEAQAADPASAICKGGP